MSKMNAHLITELFEICIEKGIVKSHTDYLFERHFFMAFWKKYNMFGIETFPRVLA